MIFVGKYDEHDLATGKDKVDVAKAKEETGLRYTESKIVKEKERHILNFGYVQQKNLRYRRYK